MRTYLLDTHTLLWWYGGPSDLTKDAYDTIADSQNKIYLSSVSTWEIIIKKQLGKISIPDSFFEIIQTGNFLPLPITIEHTLKLKELPHHHKDPFDRLLIAQALRENMSIITRDTNIKQYDVPIVTA